MIVRMSKIELAGPKGVLDELLSLLQEFSNLQIEPGEIDFIEKPDEDFIKSIMPDESTISERLFLEDLRAKLEELFSYLPDIQIRTSYLEPRLIIDSVSETLKKHIQHCKDIFQRKEAFQDEMSSLNRYRPFLETVGTLLKDVNDMPDLDFIGLTIKDLETVEYLKELLSKLTDERFELLTTFASDRSIVGLITVEKAESEKVRKILGEEHIPELTFPALLSRLSFPKRLSYLNQRITEISSEVDMINIDLQKFALRWGPIYQKVRDWVNDRLSLLKATTSAFETRMCFFFYGWTPSNNVEVLRQKVKEKFSGKVIITEKEIRDEDLEKIPVILKNPPYFKPFEIFTKLLPLPRYTSCDPTPFIGIFFPIFFGMILGDIGYGLLFLVISLFIKKKVSNRTICNASKILFISSVYSIFFGILYGEFLGETGHILFGMKPICVERRTAVIPMIYFSVTVGIAHIILGLVLGIITAFKKRTKKEAFYKFFNILIILCILSLVLSFLGLFPALFKRPVIIVILILAPLLFYTGGLLAPFEILKSIGNIISYARIMAIGLTSVLIAFVANRLAGMTGDIIIGVVIAGLIHLLNMVLGVFSPTIHSLRLHYVEFFGKFLEQGGRRFEPLSKTKH